MKNRLYSILTVAMATVSLLLGACDDDMSSIGGSLSSSEVTIRVDSLTCNLSGKTVKAPDFETRSAYSLLGSIRVPEYGELDCSYLTQFLPAENLNLPDTITYQDIDSVKLILTIPKTYITGDTLAPQQMRVYSLTKQLPEQVTPSFNPEGYYDSANPLSTKSYTLSGYTFGDSTYNSASIISVKASLPLEIGRNLVKAYEENPSLFVWPQEFAKYWPGIYVTPSFGKGCIAPVYSTGVYAYYPKTVATVETDEEGEVTTVYKQVADSVCMLTTAPEVVSSININYSPSENVTGMIDEGKSVIVTPAGYVVSFRFPAEYILDSYWKDEYDLGVINNLKLSIPATQISNAYGLGLPPALLMVKTSEMDSFFAEGRLPDNKTSFTSLYSADNAAYNFNSMRQYILNLMENGRGGIAEDDLNFTLIPVTVTTEDYTDPSTYQTVTAVTSVTPYVIMPSMVELDMENALVVFTYSTQTLE